MNWFRNLQVATKLLVAFGALMAGYRVDDGARGVLASRAPQAPAPAPREERRSADGPWAVAQSAKRKTPATGATAATPAPAARPAAAAGSDVDWQEF